MKKLTSLEQYNEISNIVDRAQDALQSGGDGETGIHYTLSWILRGFDLIVTSREDSVRLGKQLLGKYEKENF